MAAAAAKKMVQPRPIDTSVARFVGLPRAAVVGACVVLGACVVVGALVVVAGAFVVVGPTVVT
jgi:hypothetical protein